MFDGSDLFCSDYFIAVEQCLMIPICFVDYFTHSDANRQGGGADFLAGFLVGGAVFGTLAYVFDPQVIQFTFKFCINHFHINIDNSLIADWKIPA